MARITGSGFRSSFLLASLASPAMLVRGLLFRALQSRLWLRAAGVLLDGGRFWPVRPARPRAAQDLDEHLLDDIGAPGWLREQAKLRGAVSLRSVQELLRL